MDAIRQIKRKPAERLGGAKARACALSIALVAGSGCAIDEQPPENGTTVAEESLTANDSEQATSPAATPEQTGGVAGVAPSPPGGTPLHTPLQAGVTTPTLAAMTTACDPAGTNAGDTAAANALNPVLTKDMHGNMSAYRASCARRVVQAARQRGLDRKAAVIAISTVIVETHLQNISEAVDHTSLGLFQQQDSWGTAAQRLDPIWATNAFLNSMQSHYPNNTWMNATTDAEIGAVCQRVQVSAFPDRYSQQVSDAKIIVNYLWKPHGRDGVGYYNRGDGTFHLSDTIGSAGSSTYAWDTGLESVPNAQILVGDWNGDGRNSVGYYNPADGSFHLSDTIGSAGTSTYAWDTNLESVPNAKILVGDWNGDGRDSVGYYNPADGSFHLSDTIGSAGSSTYAWDTGLESVPNAKILVGDWNGDGRDSVGYYNPADGSFHLSDTIGSAGSSTYAWDTNLESVPNAQILVGDWNGDGRDSVGYYNPADGSFHLSDTIGSAGSSTYAWDTALESVPNATILVGDWDGV